jgi:hypothetical protein
MRKFTWVMISLFISGCATYAAFELNDLYGRSNPENRLDQSNVSQEKQQHFKDKIQPIIESRCVVCHGCYDAPCQLKMELTAGIERGANKEKVYNGLRLFTAQVSDIKNTDIDVLQWRNKGFFPVLNEREQTPLANTQASVIYQMLKLKVDHPLPNERLLDDSFDLSLDRNQQCPTIEEFPRYRRSTPLGGMPYGLPNLPEHEYQILTQWLADGAAFSLPASLSVEEIKMVARWERFLNGDSLKEQLVARYIFEHLYLANLYFDEDRFHQYFNIVRSKTPPNTPIEHILTRRPYDSPKVERVYYRLQKSHAAQLDKRHMSYRFDQAKLRRFQQLFIDINYQVTQLPSYDLAFASNPFKTFKELPVKSRYQFLLDEAQFSIMNFIKGPVCRGQLALNVIQDHFWVVFAAPENVEHFHLDKFLGEQSALLRLPAASSEEVSLLLNWRNYAKREKKYIKEKMRLITNIGFKQQNLDLSLIWDGNGNDNAKLTIFRHFDNASVVKGFVGDMPKTAWVINYPLLERIHYLLVAGFDVYGNVQHQLKTRLYMDFLRMEGESNFITFLPKKDRNSIYESWYVNTDQANKAYFFAESDALPESNIDYKTEQPKNELLHLLDHYIVDKNTNNWRITKSHLLNALNRFKGKAVSIFPQLSFISVVNDAANATQKKVNFYSLINNSAYTNVAHLFSEQNRRLPDDDSFSLVSGIIGSYPNAFFEVNESELSNFIIDIKKITSAQAYQRFKDRYAIRRTSANFWRYSDKLHQWYKQNQSREFGLLDFNRLENR